MSAESNQVQYGYGIETAIGVPPTTGGSFKEFLPESDSLAFHETSRPSTTLRSDRQVQKNVRLNVDPNGDIPFNFSFQAIDDFLMGMMNADPWPAPLAISTSIAAVAASNKLTAAAATFNNVKVGQWIKTALFTAPANNGYARVTAKAVNGSDITLAGLTLVDEGSAVRHVGGSCILNANTLTTFCWEKTFLDLSPIKYDSFLGNSMSKLGLTFATGEPIKGTMSFSAITAAATAGVAKISTAAGAYTPAPTFDEINSNDNIMSIYQGDSLVTYDCMELQLNLNAALRARGKLGKLGPFSHGVGRFTVDAMMNVYFADRVLLDLARSYSFVGIAWRVADAAGNGYIFDLPRVRVSQGDPTNPGLDQDVISKFKLEAELDPVVSGKTFGVSRFLASE